ncbi:tetratricopeptide repeat protein [Croceicoccus sediminis]|uniref:tetratricopeptide repeat protein n=1 Tax=Croceicoccus sediminis TaxID=2571150 RepID=UPI0011840292|nr:tetratricopeptide repeat protein [Croceicoccus sediminis]
MKRSISRVAMAVALAMGATGMVAVAAPAEAAKKKGSSGEYSKEFIAVYQPISAKVDAGDTAVAAELPGLTATVKSPDEMLAAGQLIYNVGAKTSDQALQYQGVKMMADSGKLPEENVGKIYLAAGQLGYNAKDYATARSYLQKAQPLMPNDPQVPALIAETYVAEGQFVQALDLIEKSMETSRAAGQPIPDTTPFRGLAIAANNGLNDQAFKWATYVLESSPRPEYRGEAYKVLSALSPFNKEEELDLLRLMARNDGLTVRQQYMAYLQGADSRRRPAEVKSVIDMGIADGVLDGSSAIVSEELNSAKGRMAQTLKEIDTDSKNPSSGNEAMAIADVYLGYGKAAQAETLYNKAISMGVTDKAAAMTGLGIAQADQGKFAEAKSTFQQITTGNRSTLAKLWIAYVDSKTAG